MKSMGGMVRVRMSEKYGFRTSASSSTLMGFSDTASPSITNRT